MTGKHYKVIAEVFAEEKTAVELLERMRKKLANELCHVFWHDNHRFDKDKFLRACKVEIENG